MLFRSNDTATTEIYTLPLHDALPIWGNPVRRREAGAEGGGGGGESRRGGGESDAERGGGGGGKPAWKRGTTASRLEMTTRGECEPVRSGCRTVDRVDQWHLRVITMNFERYFHFCKVDSHENLREGCFSLLVHFRDSSSREAESGSFENQGVWYGSTRID